jgi:Flp pilus assembly pilin Flp
MRQRHAHRRGQGLVEYALIILLVAIALVVSVAAFGGWLDGLYHDIAACF